MQLSTTEASYLAATCTIHFTANDYFYLFQFRFPCPPLVLVSSQRHVPYFRSTLYFQFRSPYLHDHYYYYVYHYYYYSPLQSSVVSFFETNCMEIDWEPIN